MPKKYALIFLPIVALCLASSIWFLRGQSSEDMDFTPQLRQIKPLGGGSTELKPQYRIVHFWASWCGPCREEMPSLLAELPKLQQKYQMLLISEDDTAPPALSFLADVDPKGQFTRFFYWDEGKVLGQKLRIYLMPETFIFGPDGHLVRKISGSMQWNDPKNFKFLESLPSK